MIENKDTVDKPVMIYYYKIDCPICKIFERIPIEVDTRIDISVEQIDVDMDRGDRYRWWKQLCDEKLGNRVVPILVFWQYGFENGSAHIMILEKKYTGVVTSSITQQVSVMEVKILNDLKTYRNKPMAVVA